MTHIHHIIPKYMTGGIANNHPSNLKEVTVAEHAEEHRKLFVQHGHWQDELAWKGLAGLITHEESARLALIYSNKNRTWTEEQRNHFSNIRKGRPLQPSQKNNWKHMIGVDRGLHWYNNGIENRRFKKDDEIPSGFIKGRFVNYIRTKKK